MQLAAQNVQLPSGTLQLQIEHSEYPLEDLLTFAVRRNPKRGFLFVSKLLGKHIPIPPSTAARSYQRLAELLPQLQQPHFIGLAETATALGEGVYRAWRTLTGRRATFQHTTRYRLPHPVLCRFDEPHSHAPAHLIYDPGPEARQARELVVVDDELSTGTTLEALCRAWQALHPQLERLVLVSLTDWCPRRRELRSALGGQVEFVSLLRGTYHFEPAARWTPPLLPAVTGNGEDKSAWLPLSGPRLGEDSALPCTAELASILQPHDRVLILGTGEYQYPAFALAHQLEPLVAQVHWSATTRSPILPGPGIQHASEFLDNVGDGIPNYLYNVEPSRYSRIFVLYEGQCHPDTALLRQLGLGAVIWPVRPQRV